MKGSLKMQALPMVQNLSSEASFLNLDTNPISCIFLIILVSTTTRLSRPLPHIKTSE